jgi:hypothetical protein
MVVMLVLVLVLVLVVVRHEALHPGGASDGIAARDAGR